jgi:hypothetical protein
MKNKTTPVTEPKLTNEELLAMLAQRDALLNTIASEMIGSQDFICTYMRLMCVLHDGSIDLADLATRYGFNMQKLGALSAAGNHFAARGMIKRGSNADKFSI